MNLLILLLVVAQMGENMQSLVKVVLTTALVSVILVTVVGYFDEGHPRIYDYLAHYAVPPIHDYVLWLVIFECIVLAAWWLVRAASHTSVRPE